MAFLVEAGQLRRVDLPLEAGHAPGEVVLAVEAQQAVFVAGHAPLLPDEVDAPLEGEWRHVLEDFVREQLLLEGGTADQFPHAAAAAFTVSLAVAVAVLLEPPQHLDRGE